jgi:CspA family cold shock protein
VPQGTVKWFSTQKGYGFITQDEGGDIFVHVTGLAPGTTGLEENQRVEFELSEGRKGPQATDVKPASAAAPAPAAAAEPEPEAEAEAEDEDEDEDEASSDEEV